MIFQHTWQDVMSGRKTQTRRIVKAGESSAARFNIAATATNRVVLSASGRIKWYTGGTYAVQPGRGKKAIGRIRITGIRKERLQEISEKDALAEGIDVTHGIFKRDGTPDIDPAPTFALLWNEVHGAGAWGANPEVWVVEVELEPAETHSEEDIASRLDLVP